MSDIKNPKPDFSGAGPVEYQPTEAESHDLLEQILASETGRILAIPGVTSVGIGHGHPGGEAVSIGVVDAGVADHLPREINGYPVVITVTGPVDALRSR